MAETQIRRKKRLPDQHCANPLFLKWLEEWRDEAQEKGLNSYHSYNKVVRSIKRYPLPLQSGTEARILEGCGEKIAKMLDKKLAKLRSNSTDNVSHSPTRTGVCSQKLSPTQTAHHSIKNTVSSQMGTGGSTGGKNSKDREERTTSGPGSDDIQEGLPKKKRKKTTKEYVPAYRSGGYAVLVALWKAEESGNYRGFMTKSELQSAAQPYSETSFTVPEPNSHYTAWSSMSTMIAKQFVVKKGSPARYSLTEKGLEMAERLLQASSSSLTTGAPVDSSVSSDESDSSDYPTIPSTSSRSTRQQPKPTVDSSSVEPHNSLISTQRTKTEVQSRSVGSLWHRSPQEETNLSRSWTEVTPSVFQYNYVDSDGKCVEEKDKAAVTFDASIMVGYLVKCRKSQLRASKVSYLIDRSRRNMADDEYIYVYLGEEDAHDVAPGITGNHTVISKELPKTKFEMNSSSQLSASQSRSSGCAESRSEVIDLDEDDMDEDDSSWLCSGAEKDTSREVVLCEEESVDGICELPLFARIGTDRVEQIRTTHQVEASGPSSSETTAEGPTSQSTRVPESQPMPLIIESSKVVSEKSTGYGQSSVEMDTSLNILQAGREQSLARRTAGQSVTRSTAEQSVTRSTAEQSVTRSTAEQSVTRSTAGQSVTRSTGGQYVEGRAAGQSSLVDSRGQTLTSAKLPAESPLFVLRPGHFDVVLIVDNCETNAKSHFRGVLLKELSKYGVKFQVRKLQVGDFLWVAQENVSHLPGQLSLPKAREIVLEHIIERKRMDDLASSIIDKRFGEQKFRLSNCGLTRPIYLVESYGDAAHFSIPEKSLMQAIANTQVTEGFHIVTTGNIQESVAYLTFMTRYIQSIYLTMSLEAHSMEYFSHHHNGKSGVRLPGSSGIRLMEFSEFNEAAIKNKALQITEMFAKQLMQIPGVSVDKAAAIVQLYKTPVELFEAYESCSTDKDKVMLLARVKSGHANRNFGPMLSRRICSLFHSQTNS